MLLLQDRGRTPSQAVNANSTQPDLVNNVLASSYQQHVPGEGEMRHGTEGWHALETSCKVLYMLCLIQVTACTACQALLCMQSTLPDTDLSYNGNGGWLHAIAPSMQVRMSMYIASDIREQSMLSALTSSAKLYIACALCCKCMAVPACYHVAAYAITATTYSKPHTTCA